MTWGDYFKAVEKDMTDEDRVLYRELLSQTLLPHYKTNADGSVTFFSLAGIIDRVMGVVTMAHREGKEKGKAANAPRS